ncbi:redoxin domain-containing protein [Allorhizocola rhizosphaerae]|uniref:redoxin domain-containing protein n=1 Tax=Allorhizocola rhizosphaerae TaxID=1872709 RepID=UPI001B8C6916|nr:redoxin domain-containing protein [Allorhizocola rhizosphaerae]
MPEILAFKAKTVDGREFDGATLAGKPTVFWFWAAWCSKCKGDAAAVRDVAAATTGKVNVVGVAGLGSGDAAMKNFVSTYKLDSFPQLADDKGDVWKRLKVTTQHYYVIVDGTGRELHRGPLSVSQLREKIGA